MLVLKRIKSILLLIVLILSMISINYSVANSQFPRATSIAYCTGSFCPGGCACLGECGCWTTGTCSCACFYYLDEVMWYGSCGSNSD